MKAAKPSKLDKIADAIAKKLEPDAVFEYCGGAACEDDEVSEQGHALLRLLCAECDLIFQVILFRLGRTVLSSVFPSL